MKENEAQRRDGGKERKTERKKKRNNIYLQLVAFKFFAPASKLSTCVHFKIRKKTINSKSALVKRNQPFCLLCFVIPLKYFIENQIRMI